MSTNVRPPVAWRGVPEAEVAPDGNAAQASKVLLLTSSSGNRDRLAAHLQRQYRVQTTPGESPAFDLAVVDAAGLSQWYGVLEDAKFREAPSFLPTVLVLPKPDLKLRLRRFWDVVDEFITSPVDPAEFSERVAMLLHIRQLALAQRSHLNYLVNHDRSTGLPNKNALMERLTHAIGDASVVGQHLYVAVIRIPMEHVLRSLGHRGLERAASVWSSRMQGSFGADITLTRLTTEEWAFVGHTGMPLDELVNLCQGVRKLAESPAEIDGERVHFAPRIGVGAYPDDAADAQGVLDCAMAALSHGEGHDPAFYSRSTQHRALRFVRTEARLHEAIREDQFEAWLQPQIALDDGRILGAEALIRWRLPSGDLVPPGDFLGVAAATGLVRDIDAWILERACRAVNEWSKYGAHPYKLAVNVAAPTLQQDDFAERVLQALKNNSVPPSQLELELTEEVFLETDDLVLRQLGRLREQGVGIAIDDFGTGYSSLGYLHALPITTLKIDKRFLVDVENDRTNDAITRTIVWLAKNFDLDIVAEGIETPMQAEYVRSLGVHRGQGFLYGRPVAKEEFRSGFLV